MNTTDRSLNSVRRRANSRSSTILHATRDERAVGLIGRRQLLAEPGHGAVEMMELQAVDTVDAIVVAPLLAGAIGAGDHQSVKDGEEDSEVTTKRGLAPSGVCSALPTTRRSQLQLPSVRDRKSRNTGADRPDAIHSRFASAAWLPSAASRRELRARPHHNRRGSPRTTASEDHWQSRCRRAE